MRKLKTSEIAGVRDRLLIEQGGRCALCQGLLPKSEAALDHCHTTGLVRAVLHKGCNSMLGKLENSQAMYGLRDPVKFQKFLKSIPAYITAGKRVTSQSMLHPTHKTEEEKRERKNKRAKAAYQKRKETAAE